MDTIFGYIIISGLLIISGLFLLLILHLQKKRQFDTRKKAKEGIAKILNQYGLNISDMMLYYCKYVGGHPDRDSSSNGILLLFGTQNGKLIFFEGIGIHCAAGEGGLTSDRKLRFYNQGAELRHLFDIPINSIEGIRYFDETTNRTVGLIGGNHWAIPVNMKKGDASVLIDWYDGRYNHSTEFRLGSFLGGGTRSTRANTLRNTLIRMTKV